MDLDYHTPCIIFVHPLSKNEISANYFIKDFVNQALIDTNKSYLNNLQSIIFTFRCASDTHERGYKHYTIWKMLREDLVIKRESVGRLVDDTRLKNVLRYGDEWEEVVEKLGNVTRDNWDDQTFTDFYELGASGNIVKGGRASLTRWTETKTTYMNGNYISMTEEHAYNFLSGIKIQTEMRHSRVQVTENSLKGAKTAKLVKYIENAKRIPDLSVGYNEGFSYHSLLSIVYEEVEKHGTGDTHTMEQYTEIKENIQQRLSAIYTYVVNTNSYYWSQVDEHGKYEMKKKNAGAMKAFWELIPVTNVVESKLEDKKKPKVSSKTLVDVLGRNDSSWVKICEEIDSLPFRKDQRHVKLSSTDILNIYSPLPYVLGRDDDWAELIAGLFIERDVKLGENEMSILRSKYPESMFKKKDQTLYHLPLIQESVNAVYDHLKSNVCAGHSDKWRFFANFVLIPFVNPGFRSDRAIIMTGKEGVGKSQFFIALSYLLGDKMKITESFWDTKASGFNSAEMSGKLFMVLEEFHFKSKVGGMEAINNMITEHETRLNRKNEPIYYETNSKNYVMVTNHDRFVLPGSSEMRRFVILNVDNNVRFDKYLKSQYFTTLQKCFQSRFFMLLLLEAMYLDYEPDYDFSQAISSANVSLRGQMMNKKPSTTEQFLLNAINKRCNGTDISEINEEKDKMSYERYVFNDQDGSYHNLLSGLVVADADNCTFKTKLSEEEPMRPHRLYSKGHGGNPLRPLELKWEKYRVIKEKDYSLRDIYQLTEYCTVGDNSYFTTRRRIVETTKCNVFSDSAIVAEWPRYEMLYIFLDRQHPHGSLDFMYLSDLYPKLYCTTIDSFESCSSFSWATFQLWYREFQIVYEESVASEEELKYYFCRFFCRRYPIKIDEDESSSRFFKAVVTKTKDHFKPPMCSLYMMFALPFGQYESPFTWFHGLLEWSDEFTATKKRKRDEEIEQVEKRKRIEEVSDDE